MDFQIGQAIKFTNPGTGQEGTGVINALNDGGFYNISYMLDSGSTAEVSVSPDFVWPMPAEAVGEQLPANEQPSPAPEPAQTANQYSPQAGPLPSVQQALRDMVLRKAAHYGGFIKDAPTTVDLFGTKFKVDKSQLATEAALERKAWEYDEHPDKPEYKPRHSYGPNAINPPDVFEDESEEDEEDSKVIEEIPNPNLVNDPEMAPGSVWEKDNGYWVVIDKFVPGDRMTENGGAVYYHSSTGPGVKGYLTFIDDFLPQKPPNIIPNAQPTITEVNNLPKL